MNVLVTPYLNQEIPELNGYLVEEPFLSKQMSSPFLIDIALEGEDTEELLEDDYEIIDDSYAYTENEVEEEWDDIAEIENLEDEETFYDEDESFFEEEFDYSSENELLIEDAHHNSKQDNFDEEYDDSLQDEFTDYEDDSETGYDNIDNEFLKEGFNNEDVDDEYYDNYEEIEDYLDDEDELHSEEADFDEYEYEKEIKGFKDDSEIEIIDYENDTWREDNYEELNEWESIEEDELEEDLIGFGFLKRKFLSDVTFQNGVSIPTISGPEFIGQEFYDPNDSNNPLLDTSIKNRKKKLSKNFSVGEFAQSGEGKYKFYKARIDPELVNCLQKLRDFLYTKSVVVIDGYYSYAHLQKIAKHRKIKKVPRSPHLSGQGAKIKVKGMYGIQIAKAIIISCDPTVSISIGTYSASLYIKQPETKITSYIRNKAKKRAARSIVNQFRKLYGNKPTPLQDILDQAYIKLKRSLIATKMNPYANQLEIPWDIIEKASLYIRNEIGIQNKDIITEALFYSNPIKILRYHLAFDLTKKNTNIGGLFWKLCNGKIDSKCKYEKKDHLANHLYKSFNQDASIWRLIKDSPVFDRPSPRTSQNGPLDKGSKGERDLAEPKPDVSKYNISGRYEIFLSGRDKANFIGSTLCINQAGNHIEGVLANVSSLDNINKNKTYHRIYGGLKENGSYSVFVRNEPQLNFKLIPKGNNIDLYKEGSSVGLTFRKISYTPILTEVALFKQPQLLKSYEWFPLLNKQKELIIKYFGDRQKISEFLKKFYEIKRSSWTLHKEKLQAMAVANFNNYVYNAMNNSKYGVHSSDIVLARFYIRALVGNSRWRPNSNYPYLTQLDWLQRMVSIDIFNKNNTHRQGGSSSTSSIKKYIGIDPSWSKGVDPNISLNVYKVSVKISGGTAGMFGVYRGDVTIEKIDQRRWPEKVKKITFKITLGAFGFGIGLKANDTMEGEVLSPIYWVPQDFPGWVEVAFAGGGIGVGGVKGSINGGFMHIKGRGNLPVLKVLFTNKGISPTGGKLSIGAELTMLMGKIHDKKIPVNLDFLSIKTKTDYSVIYKLHQDVHFALGSAILTNPARQAIRIMCAHELVGLINSRSELKIIAHTDRIDTFKRNLALSAMRAANVQQAIEDVLGNKLKARFTQVTGKGETEAAKIDEDDKENPKYRKVDVFLNARLVLRLSTL